MITLVLVKNPFSPQDGREVKYIEAHGTIADLLAENSIENVDLQATVNGYSVDGATVVHDGDFVVIYPIIEKGGSKGGKGILGIVAAIALSVVSFGVGGLVGAGAWGASMATWGVMGYVAAAAVMFLGSSLIGRVSGQNIDTGSYSKSEATYSWSGVQTMEGQNNPIALTYGTVKSGGQTIGKYTMASGSDDFLYWLVAAGEGELTFSDIKLNDNPISMYQSVSYQTRSGTNDQSVINYFGDTRYTAPLSYNMDEGTWYTNSAQGTATQGLIIKIECPNGLLHTTNQGKVKENYVAIQIEIQDVTGGSSWTAYNYFSGADMSAWDSSKNALVIKGSSRTAIRKEFRIDGIDPSEYAVRVRVSAVGYTNEQMDMFQVYWTGLSSVIYDDFTYPCTALIGIKAKATDQLSGNPTLTFLKSRDVVYVWNPHINEYQTKLANNPAWACYDLIHQCRPIKNIRTKSYEYEVRGADKALMRYDDFDAWATYCSNQNYYVNIEIVQIGEMLDVANERIAPIGHGRVVRFGTKYGCIFSHPQEAVQMFGMGNILEGTFKEEFLKVADRANCVEVTFTNAKADYQRDVVAVYGDTYNTDGYEKTAQVTMDGITNFSQAYREGVYQLQCNKLQLRTVSFEAGVDAIACTVGDVVKIAHDVPQWQFSGHVESVDLTTSTKKVVLPCTLQTNKTYTLQWRESATDTLYEHSCTVVSVDNGYTTVTFTNTVYPSAGDVFSVAVVGTEDKLFTVQSITRAQDFTRNISCLEYNEDVFEEPTNYDGDDEHERVFVVSIQQYENEGITVRKYKGSESITYSTSFTESETGWYIEINLDSPAGYAPGELLVNGVVYTTGVDFPLNRNYTITATSAAVGQTVYINGNTDHIYGSPDLKWFCMYSDSACTQRVNRKNLVGRLRCIATNDSIRDGVAMFGSYGDITGGNADWCEYVTEIDQYVETGSMIRLTYAFNRCEHLQSVNLTNWDTGDSTSFGAMFLSCGNLLHVGDISHWDTTYVTSISSMFEGCGYIESLDLSGWTTPQLINCSRAFLNCSSMQAIDISGWNTSNINGVTSMFLHDSNLQYIIMDAHEIKFSGEYIFDNPNNSVKYLVPADMVASYKAHANWSSRASQIDSIANYNIIRSNGHVTVTER